MKPFFPRKTLAGAAFLLLSRATPGACTPTPPSPPPGPDASDSGAHEAGPAPSTPCGQACANLARLGCVEGTWSDCEAVCVHETSTRIAPLDVAGIEAATTKDAVRKAGVACP